MLCSVRARFASATSSRSSPRVFLELLLERFAKTVELFAAFDTSFVFFDFDTGARRRCRAPLLRDLFFGFFELGAFGFQPFDELSDLALLLVLELARPRHDRFGKPETLGHLERKAPSRSTVDNLVRGLIRFWIELERGRVDTVGRARVRLEKSMVCRCDHERASLEKMLDESGPECSTFSRVGAGSHFVENDEGRKLALALHGHDLGEVRRERRQVGGDRLVIADVGEDRTEHGKRAIG